MFKRAIAILFLAGVAWAETYPGQDLSIGSPFTLSNGVITPQVVMVKSSSTFTQTGTGLASIPNMSVTLQAGTTYQFDYYLLFQTTTTTTGARFAVAFSTTPTAVSYVAEIPVAADGTGGAVQGWGTASADAVVGTGVQAVNTSYLARISGVVVTRQGLSCTMSPQIGSELANNNANSMANSVGIITVIP